MCKRFQTQAGFYSALLAPYLESVARALNAAARLSPKKDSVESVV